MDNFLLVTLTSLMKEIPHPSNAFVIFGEAFYASKEGLWVSLEILIILTIVLATVFYFCEISVKPKRFSYGKSLLWAFTRYIDDPGDLSKIRPRTMTGKLVATSIGILGILIVAVPAGILGSGFSAALENQKEKDRIATNQKKLEQYFERRLDRPSGYQAVNFFKSFASIQARTGMTENEIIEIATHIPDFRIIDLSSTIPMEQHSADRLAIEMIPYNTPYGCFIDRGSKVTIISTSGIADASISIFSFYLALIGNFNYISREFGDQIAFKSLFHIKDGEEYTTAEKQYFEDLKKLMSQTGSWGIDLMPVSGSNENTYDSELHFGIGNPKGVEDFETENLTVKDINRYKIFYKEISKSMKEKFDILTDNGKYHDTSGKTVWRRVIDLPTDANSFVIRIAYSSLLWNDDRLLIAKEIADNINKYLLNNPDSKEPTILKEKDFGYNGYDL